MSQPVRLLLAEPDAPTRTGIRLVLEGAGFEIYAEPLDGAAAVEAAVECGPAICLVAERLPGGAAEALHAVYRRLPAAKLVLLTESDDAAVLFANDPRPAAAITVSAGSSRRTRSTPRTPAGP